MGVFLKTEWPMLFSTFCAKILYRLFELQVRCETVREENILLCMSIPFLRLCLDKDLGRKNKIKVEMLKDLEKRRRKEKWLMSSNIYFFSSPNL